MDGQDTVYIEETEMQEILRPIASEAELEAAVNDMERLRRLPELDARAEARLAALVVKIRDYKLGRAAGEGGRV